MHPAGADRDPFNDEEQDAVFQIDDRQLFEKIDRLGKLPTTSAPSTGKWAEAFKDAFNDGADEVICFCVSAAVSGTYGSAIAAVEFVPGRTITVVDTQSLAIAHGFYGARGCKAAAEGEASAEIIAHAFSFKKEPCMSARWQR